MKLAERITKLELDVEYDGPCTAAGSHSIAASDDQAELVPEAQQSTGERFEVRTEARTQMSLPAARAPVPTRHTRRSVLAPALLGSAAAAAIEELRACGLNPAVELQETDERSEHGTVIAQEPQAGEDLARGATLALWVGAPYAAQIDDDDAELTEASPDETCDASVTAECGAQSVDALDDGWFDLPGASVPSSEPGEIDRAGARVAGSAAERDEPDGSRAAPSYGSPVQTRVRYALGTIAVGVLLLVLGRALMPHQDTPTTPQMPTASNGPSSVRRDATGAASRSRNEPRVVAKVRPRPARTVRPRSRRALHRRARSRHAPARGKSTSSTSPPVAASGPTAARADAAPRSLPHVPAPPRPRQSEPPSSSSRTVEREFFTP